MRRRKKNARVNKSRAIVLKNNLPTKKPPKIKELIVPAVQSTHALTLDRETGKVYSFSRMRYRVAFEMYNHYWPWNEESEEVKFKVRERKRKNRSAPRSHPKPKEKISLTKLERTQKIRGEGLNKISYDPKSDEKFGGIVG